MRVIESFLNHVVGLMRRMWRGEGGGGWGCGGVFGGPRGRGRQMLEK